ncbi:RNA methyltransferase [Seleniivibrio woodruffii]|uniref:TrmH family RNA methyltransferase n=1 Tax=Seleniivibrio woodruffii TaxID=1078050 RepID=UPI0026EDD473|nr:RNA methyltransferase [Seleniivibrio woodruffii]
MIVHGRNTVEEALKLDMVKLLHVKVNSTFDPKRFGVEYRTYGSKEFEHFFGQEAQGVAAEIKDIEPKNFDKAFDKILENGPVIVLDRIFDPHNYGAIIRAANCFGVKTVLVGFDKQAPVTAAVCKASSGTIFHTLIVGAVNTATALKKLKDSGYKAYAADVNGQTALKDAVFDQKSALIMGSEGKGIRPALLEMADTHVKIPMRGDIDSLNVAQSAAVILYEFTRNL